MVFCKDCGTKIEEGVRFCTSCGAAAENVLNAAAENTQNTAAAAEASASFASAATEKSTPYAAAETAIADKKDAADNKVMAILAYIIVLIPLFAARNSVFARYHTNQGLILAILGIIYVIALNVIGSLLILISWRLALSVTGILGLVGWVFLVFCIIGIVNVCKGEMKPLPLIGGFRILK